MSYAAPLSCPSPFCEAGLLASSLQGDRGDSVKASPQGEGPPTREEAVEGEKMQANPAYLPIQMMSYNPQESKYINVSS